MKIAVIAASGRSGKAFVQVALDAGHDVRAGVRGESDFKPHPNLEIVQCDATVSDDVDALIAGQDAVISLIGHVKGSADDVQTKAIRLIIASMKKQGISRLVSLTGTGVRFPGDKITLADRFLNLSIQLSGLSFFPDGKNHVQELRNSDLDWTIIRVLKLQNIPPKPFQLKEHGPTKLYVGRTEVAQAILQVIEQRSFIRQAPIIGRQNIT